MKVVAQNICQRKEKKLTRYPTAALLPQLSSVVNQTVIEVDALWQAAFNGL